MAAVRDAERVERFRELYDPAYPRIMAYALRRARNREDALDVVSETFMVVWRRLDDVPTDERAVPWVYGVARRVLANQYRSTARRGMLENRLKDERVDRSGAEPSEVVNTALGRLRPGDREVLTLAAWDDLANREIAQVLGVSEKNVAVRLHRARARLAAELARLGMHSSPRNPDPVKSEDGDRTPNEVNGTHPEPEEVETP